MNAGKEICICGAGHQGLSMAAHLSLNGNKVKIWNRSYENIKKLDIDKRIYCDGVVNGIASIEKVSTNIKDVISNFIMITTPSSAHRSIARVLAPYVNSQMIIILNPGRTFGTIDFLEELKKCNVKELPQVAETQTIVYTCRKKTENSTTIFALKHNVKIAASKRSNIHYIMDNIPECLKKYFVPVKSLLETSFSNVGMVLHCSPVLMNIGWIESEKADFKYYYDGISKSVARFLEKIDVERCAVSKALGIESETVEEWMKRTYNVRGDNYMSALGIMNHIGR